MHFRQGYDDCKITYLDLPKLNLKMMVSFKDQAFDFEGPTQNKQTVQETYPFISEKFSI